MVNHSLIKLLLFNLAGVVYMNIHALEFNTIRGFGRRKPFLMVCFLMGALGIGGMPLWNGYVSKTLIHDSIVEYIVHLTSHGHNAVLFQAIEWIFLFSGGLTVAYMLKIVVCLFVEKHPKEQEKYDGMTNYMSGASKAVLGISAMILPVLGFFPGMTIDKMADAVMGFMRSGPLHHQVHYFTWINLKGGLISIGIGIVVYFFVIRRLLIKNGEYVELWPKWLDMEVLFSKLVWGMIDCLGLLSKILDGFLSEWCTVEHVLKVLNDLMKLPERLPEAVISLMKRTVYKETTERPELEFTNKLHAQYDRKVDTLRLIGSSLSFGLLLACVGLILTIIYLLMH